MTEREMQERWVQNQRNVLTSEIARSMRRLGYATLALFLVMVVVVLAGSYIRMRDLRHLVRENEAVITKLEGQTRVLCDRGFLLIDLTEGALVLIGQRLEADIKKGEAAAVRADQEFLKKYLAQRERLVREQTDPGSPCAVG